jgi:hypothetical protein
MISPRFAAPVAALLALALVPTVIHSYREIRTDDGLRAEALAGRLDGMTSSPTGRRADWVKRNFATTDFVERTYRKGAIEVSLFVARSYDPKRLYHHPELAILRGLQTRPAGVTRTTARPEIPLHVLETERDSRQGVAVYALLYDDRFIDNPLLFQLRTSFELLVGGRKPLTLFMASALEGSRQAIEKAPATGLLLAAIADFERQTPSAPAPE